MTESGPYIDFANLPAPEEGILASVFITVRKVARSRDFYSRVLGGTVVLEENPCIVKLSNSWIIMNPGGPPTPDKPGISVVDYEPGATTSIFLIPRDHRYGDTTSSPVSGPDLAPLIASAPAWPPLSINIVRPPGETTKIESP